MKIDQIESGTFSLVRMGRANKFLFYKGGPISNFLAYHRSIWRKLSQQYIDNSRFWPTLTSTPAFSKDITTDVNLIIQWRHCDKQKGKQLWKFSIFLSNTTADPFYFSIKNCCMKTAIYLLVIHMEMVIYHWSKYLPVLAF